MSHPLRIQRKRTKGYRLPAGAVCVTRPGKWGNPYKTADLFRQWKNLGFPIVVGDKIECAYTHADIRKELCGKQLACWCHLTKDCHADVLAEVANS